MSSSSCSSFTPQEIYTAMEQALLKDGAMLKKKFGKSVIFDLENNGVCWKLDTQSGVLVEKDDNTFTDADLVIKTSLATLQELLHKQTTPQQAFLNQKLRISGNMGLAMKLTVVLNAVRKQLPVIISRL